MSLIQIDNMPDANELWKGIGGYFDSLGEILCEFIDNSISNFIGNPSIANNSIMIGFKDRGDYVDVSVADSGTGIKDLNAAFTLGSHAGAESLLNEHGFGFKHALASANPDNNGWLIRTCTDLDSKDGQYKEIRAPYLLTGFSADIVQGNFNSELGNTGTIVEFTCTKEMFMTIRRGLSGNFQRMPSVVDILREDLGFIYSGVLSEKGLRIILIVEDAAGNQIYHNVVSQVTPNWEGYYNPKQGSEYYDLGHGNVKIDYTFGKIGVHPDTKKYYKKNMASSGVEIRINGRILAYNQIRTIWGKEPHPSFNQFLAVINLISSDAEKLPKTKTSKNGLREGDPHLIRLFDWIQAKCPIIPKNAEPLPEDLDERELFSELSKQKKIHLSTLGIGTPTVETELYAYDNLQEKIRIDLYVAVGSNITLYEGKKDKTTVKDLYQLMMYWDGCVYDGKKPTQGILISAEHPKSVKDILAVLNTMQDANGDTYNFVLKTWKEEGIQYPS